MFDEKDRKYFYNEFKNNGYEVGSYDDFKQDLNNKEDRDWYYNEAKNMGYDVGSQEDFDKMVLDPAPSSSTAASSSSSTQSSPVATSAPQAEAIQQPQTDKTQQQAEPTKQVNESHGILYRIAGMPMQHAVVSNGTYQPAPVIEQPIVDGISGQQPVHRTPVTNQPVDAVTGANSEEDIDAIFGKYIGKGDAISETIADLMASGKANSQEQAQPLAMAALNRAAQRLAKRTADDFVGKLGDTVANIDQSIYNGWYSHDIQDALKSSAAQLGIYNNYFENEQGGVEEVKTYDQFINSYVKPAMVESLVHKYGENYRKQAEDIATRLYSHDDAVQGELMNRDINSAIEGVVSKYVQPSVVEEYNKAQEAGKEAFNASANENLHLPGSAFTSLMAESKANDAQKVLDSLNKKFANLYKNGSFLTDIANATYNVMQQYGAQGGLSAKPEQFKPLIQGVLKNELTQLEVKGLMPKGSADYIIKSGLGNTILGKIERKALHSGYQNWLEDMANQQYQPGFWENVASGALTFAGDAWSYWLPGAAGGKITKAMLAKAEGRLATDLFAKGMSEKAAERAAKLIVGRSKSMALKQGMVHGATTFGGQAVASTPVNEIYKEGQPDEEGMTYKTSVGKILYHTLGDVAKGAALGAVMQGGTLANIAGKGRGLAANILTDVGGKIADSSIMAGQSIIEHMAADPSFKPTGKDAARSFLESMANLTAIGLPGMMGKYSHFKSAQEFNRKFDFTNEDLEDLNRLGYGNLYEVFKDMGINDNRMLEGDGELMGQLSQKYMDFMSSKSVPETLKAKVMAVVEGKRPDSFSPVMDSQIIQPVDGKPIVETYNEDGGIIERKQYSSIEAAEKANKKLDYEKSLNLTAAYESAYHSDAMQDRLNTQYQLAVNKYNVGEKLSDEDKAAIYLHQNADAIKDVVNKQQQGMELTDKEQQLWSSYKRIYDGVFENSPIMKEYIRTFEDSMGVHHGTLRKALEGDGKSRTKEQQQLVEAYQKQLYGDIVLRRDGRMDQVVKYTGNSQNESMSQLPGTPSNTNSKETLEENASGRAVIPVDGNISPSDGGTPPSSPVAPVEEQPAPENMNTAEPAPAMPSEAYPTTSEAFVMGQNAYNNGDSDVLKAISRNDDLSVARLQRLFKDNENQVAVIQKAYSEGKDMEECINQRANYLTAAQKDAIRKYVEAQDAKKGVYDALQHADDGYGDSLKEQLWPYATEDGNIVPATLTSGQQVFLKKSNEYGGGFVVVPDEQAAPVIKQVASSEVKEVGIPVPFDEYIAQLTQAQQSNRAQAFFSQFNGSGLKPNETVEIAMEPGDDPIQMIFAGYSPDGKIILSDGHDNISLSKDEFNVWKDNALQSSINAELDAEDIQRSNDEAMKAEADKKQRYVDNIVGYGEGQIDYSSKESNPKVVAEYLQEQYGEDHSKLINLINGSRHDIKEQLNNKKKAAAEYEQWLDTNADLDPDKARKVNDELKLVNEQIADLEARYKNWNTIRNSVMTDDEARAMRDERKKVIEQNGIDESAIVPSEEREVPVLSDEELKKQYPTMDEASTYITSQRKQIYKIQSDEVQRELDGVNNLLEQYINGEIDLGSEQLKELNTTKAQLEARHANLNASAKDLKAQADNLKNLYRKENMAERAERMANLSPAEQRAIKVENAIKDRNLSALNVIYEGTSVNFTDDTPNTIKEYVAGSIGRHILNFEGKEKGGAFSNGVMQETGLSRKDFNQLQVLAREGEGMTVPEFVHKLYNAMPDHLRDQGFTDQDIRDALLDLLDSVGTYQELKNYTLREKVANAENEMRAIDAEEERMRDSYEKETMVDGQGNPINEDGSLRLEQVKSVAELTDDDFLRPSRNVELPTIPSNIDAAIGANGKPVVIKKNIFERNMGRHGDLTPEQSRKLFLSALYNADLYGQTQKSKRPYNWICINTKDEEGKNRTVLLEVNPNKDNVEVVHWHFVDKKGLEKLKRQAEREDGQLLILPSNMEEVGALSDPTISLPSGGKGTNISDNNQENGQVFSERLKNAISETETEPTDAQKKAGNYKKGHLSFGGYNFTVETPKGATRSGKDENGKPWSVTMHDTYGYILGKIGVDGDHIDMFINDSADLDNFNGDVVVIDQVNPDTGKFDEHKVMYGYPDEAAAMKAYLSNYSKDWKGLGKLTSVPKATFDKWLESSDRKTKPFREYAMIQKAGSKENANFLSQMEYDYANDIHPTDDDIPKLQSFAQRLVNFHNDSEDKPDYGYTILSSNIRADKLYPTEKAWFKKDKYPKGVSWIDKSNVCVYEINPRFNSRGYLTAVGVHKLIPLHQSKKIEKQLSFDTKSHLWSGIPVGTVEISDKPNRNGELESYIESNDRMLAIHNVHTGKSVIRVLTVDNQAETPDRINRELEKEGYAVGINGHDSGFVDFTNYNEAYNFAKHVDDIEERIHKEITPSDNSLPFDAPMSMDDLPFMRTVKPIMPKDMNEAQQVAFKAVQTMLKNAGIPVKVISNEDMDKVAAEYDDMVANMLLHDPNLRFNIKTPEEREAAERAYNWGKENRPDKWCQYVLVNMDRPNQMPEYFQKKSLADIQRRYYNKNVYDDWGELRGKPWGNYKLFDLNRPFEEQVKDVKGSVPTDYDPHRYDSKEYRKLKDQKNKLETELEELDKQRSDYMNSTMDKYVKELGLNNWNELPDDIWYKARREGFAIVDEKRKAIQAEIAEIEKKMDNLPLSNAAQQEHNTPSPAAESKKEESSEDKQAKLFSLLDKKRNLETEYEEAAHNLEKFTEEMLAGYRSRNNLAADAEVPGYVFSNAREATRAMYKKKMDACMTELNNLQKEIDVLAPGGRVSFLKGKGVAYGYTDGKQIVLNQDYLNPNTPLHEYQHIWRTAAKAKNPELIEHGDNLIKQTEWFKNLQGDPNYKHLSEEKLCDEAFARLTGDEGEAILEQMAKDAIKENPLDTAKELSVINKLKEWLKKFWYWTLETFTKWKSEDIKKMTLEDIRNLVLRDLAQGVDPRTVLKGQMTKDEAVSLRQQMADNAEPERILEHTEDNWLQDFGKDGRVNTPIGSIKLGENQYKKAGREDRIKRFGLLKPTLERPDVILEKPAPKEGAERQTKYLFVKSFKKVDGTKILNFASITVKQGEDEVSISAHQIEPSKLLKELTESKMLWNRFRGDSNSLGENQGSALTPSANNPSGKDSVLNPHSYAKIRNNIETAKENGGNLSVEDKIKAVSQQFGVDEADVAMYANAIKKGSTAEAARARANIKRHLMQVNEGNIFSFKDVIKYTKPINEALKVNFGDLDAMIEERRKQVEAERNAMEAARKRAEEEEAKRKKHLEELSLIPEDKLDKQYMDALAKGDDATAREMLDEAARRKGYDDTESAYQGVGAWAAPGNPGYESDKARRDDWESSGSDVNLEDMALGYTPQPDDYFSHPERYSQNTPHGLESVKAINTAIDAIKNGEKDVKVKVYRAVPTSVKEGKLRNGDWVTPSKKYAEMHGTNRLEGKYRIIEDEVPATQLWWDGNDANEFGFDDGKEYKYKNAKNNRKLNDLVTYDDEGDVIPPSKRFNSRKSDIRFMFAGEKGAAEADKAEEQTIRMDNLDVAKQMEEEKKDAKIIKMATGWEKGVDGKWRYEMPDAKIKDTIDVGGGNIVKRFEEDMLWTDGKLEDAVDAPKLFEAYPQLKNIKIHTDAVMNDMLSNGKYNPQTKTITIHADELKYLNSILNHEIQHVIQYEEGFAHGGTPEQVERDFNAAKAEWKARSYAFELEEKAKEMGGEYNQSEVEKALIQEYKDMDMPEFIPDKETRIKGFNYFARGYADRSMDDAIKRFRLDRFQRTDFDSYQEYRKLAGEVEARNVQKRLGMTDEERRNSLASETEDVNRDEQIVMNGNDASYSIVKDPDTIKKLDKEDTVKVYRAMQVGEDGKLYPPMAAKVKGKFVQPIELGKWEQADERPELADDKGMFTLNKGNGKSLKAAYNPYLHTSRTPLNDQFSEAQNRPNIVTVEVEVPKSELTSGYKADKAKDAVGEVEWKAGIIQGQLTGKRKVVLSRWDKPVRIVPDSEVADVIVNDMFKGKNITMPSNVVTPSLRKELEKRGVPFVETDNRGRIVGGENDGVHYSKVYGKKANVKPRLGSATIGLKAAKDKVVELFNKAKSGEFNGKPQSIGTLTQEGKKFLEDLSGLKMKDKIDFVLNPSDLKHMNKDHFGNNEKDPGRNIPLIEEDLRSMVDVIMNPEQVVYGIEKMDNRKAFFFLKQAEDGTLNLAEIYSDKKGNLTAKSYYKTKKGVDQRVMEIKNSLLPTPEASSGSPLSDGKGINFFSIEQEKTAENAENERKIADSVVNTANKLGGAEATVYSSLDDVPEEYRSEVEQGAKGWYDPKTHTVHVYLPNCEDGNDAQRTVFHEKIGHEGMEVLLGGEDKVRKFANFVYRSVGKNIRGKIIDFANKYDPDWKNNDRMNVGTQEYIAHLAEEGSKTAEDFSLWTKIKHYLIKVLKKLGVRVPGLLNDKDLRYYLMKAGKALHVWDNMPKEKQEAMMAQASNAEIKDALADGAGKGKPRQKKGESAIQYMKRVMEWRKWKEAREDLDDPEPPQFYDLDKDAAGKKEWEKLNKEWRGRHGLKGNDMPSLPTRNEGESDESFLSRYKDYEKWQEALKDNEDPAPDMFAWEKQKQVEASKKYEDWLARHELLEQQQADLDLYEGKIYPAETSPEAADMERKAMQDLAEVTSTDVSSEGAARTVKVSVIHRRKNMEEASADDAIYINDVKRSIEQMAESGAMDKLASDFKGSKSKAESLAEAIPYIIEAPRRLRDLTHEMNASGVFDKNHLHIQPKDVEDIQTFVPELRRLASMTHTVVKNDKEVKVFDDMEGISKVASEMAKVINGNHQGEDYFVPIDGTDILDKQILPIVVQSIVPDGIDYHNLSEEMKSALSSIRDWYNYTFDWLKDNHTLKEDVGYNADYVNHIWDKEKSDKKAYAMYVENRQRTKSPNEKKRTISTLMEGMSVGLVPKTTDITKMMAYYSRSNIEAWANKNMLQELSGINVIERDEDGEIISSDPLISSTAPFNLEQYKYFEIPGIGPVWVYNVSPKQVGKFKNPITEKEHYLYKEASAGDRFGVVFDTYQSNNFWKFMDTAASSAKKLELGFSGFHAGALTEVYMVQNMIEFGPEKALANFMKYIFVDTAKTHSLPCFANPEDFQEAATHLVKFGATNDYAAADVQNMFDDFRSAMEKIQKKLEEGNAISRAGATAALPLEVASQMLSLANKGMDVALWDFLHDGLKLATYRMRADATKARAAKQGWTQEQLSKQLDEDGQFVNDMFGGQHWDVLGVSHTTLRYAGRILLSPDWNTSTTRHFLAVTGYGSVWNEATMNNFKQYYQHVKNAARGKQEMTPEDWGRFSRSKSALLCYGLGFMVFYEAIANGLNAAFRALDEERERKKAEELRKTNPDYRSPYELAYPDGMQWYDYLMRGNSLGQQSKIFLGRYEDGTEMYIRHGKQFREVPEYLFNHKGDLEFPGPMVQRMLGKANPMVRMTLDDINYLSDFQASHADQELQRKYGKTLGLLYKDALYWAPFLIPSQENKEFKAVDFFFPSSKGFSNWKAQDYFKTFILSGDSEGVWQTYASCQRNGLDAEKQLQAAIASIKALELKEMQDGVTSLQIASERFDDAKSVKEKRKMREKMRKFLSQSEYQAFTWQNAQDMVDAFQNGEDVKELTKADDKYLNVATSQDVTEDWRIQSIRSNSKGYADKLAELQETDKAKAAAFKNAHANIFKARKTITKANSKMNKLKKKLGEGNDKQVLQQIRNVRQELLKDLKNMEHLKKYED